MVRETVDGAPASVCLRNHGQVKCMVVQVRSPYLRGVPKAVCVAGVSRKAFCGIERGFAG